MKTPKTVNVVDTMLICTLVISVFALDAAASAERSEQSEGQVAAHSMKAGAIPKTGFIVSKVFQSAEPIYALAGGEFDLNHRGLEIACLSSDGVMGRVLQLSPNFLTWEISVRYEEPTPITDMKSRPTIGIGDVHSGYPGNEVVIFTRHPSIVTLLFHDPNGAWSHVILEDKSDWTGDGWGARVGDYDPYRPGDEVFFIHESPMDFSSGTLIREIAGVWEKEYIYGLNEIGEVGMDSAAGDFNWDHSGPEIVIATEMGPTYELLADQDPNQEDWPRRTVWDEHDDAAWVVKVADVDPWSPGNEIVYGTRYSNRIMMSRHNGDQPHDLEILFTGNAIAQELGEEMWDIAVGDVVPENPGLEILGVDETGAVYLVQRMGDSWEGQVIWQDSAPLYALAVGDFLPQRRGDEILVTGKSGAITMLVPRPECYRPGK